MAGRAYPGISLVGMGALNPTKACPCGCDRNSLAIKKALSVIDTYLRDATHNIPAAGGGGGGGGGADAGEPYVLAATPVTSLPAHRVLAASSPITKTDGGAGGTITIGLSAAALGGTPAITYSASAAAAGAASTFVKTDATLLAPSFLRSTTNSTTLTLTDDGTKQVLTGSLGNLEITPAVGVKVALAPSTAAQFVVAPDTTTGSPQVMSVQIRPQAGNYKGIISNFFSGSVSGAQTLLAWDGTVSGSFISTDCFYSAFGSTAFGPTISSGTNNVLYGAAFKGPTQGGVGSSVVEVGSLRLYGANKSIGTPVIPVGYGIRMEMPRLGQTDQIGIFLDDAGTGHTPTNRIGISIPAMAFGTTRIGLKIAVDTSTSSNVHMNLVDKTADPASPNAGDLWRNGDNIKFKQSSATYNMVMVTSPATYTASNVTTDRSYDANSTTLDELADVVGTLITDLKLTGIIV